MIRANYAITRKGKTVAYAETEQAAKNTTGWAGTFRRCQYRKMARAESLKVNTKFGHASP